MCCFRELNWKKRIRNYKQFISIFMKKKGVQDRKCHSRRGKEQREKYKQVTPLAGEKKYGLELWIWDLER